jgi:hypothetical protein
MDLLVDATALGCPSKERIAFPPPAPASPEALAAQLLLALQLRCPPPAIVVGANPHNEGQRCFNKGIACCLCAMGAGGRRRTRTVVKLLGPAK